MRRLHKRQPPKLAIGEEDSKFATVAKSSSVRPVLTAYWMQGLEKDFLHVGDEVISSY
jgi:hypothetical protein